MSTILSDVMSPKTSSSSRRSALKKMTLLQLIAATYFMVAGGPYGLEDLVQHTGYFWAAVVLLLTPLLWSAPTALMVSELSSALPDEGGYYVWVRRAMGPFWGFQEAWLSLAASVFDMAIYPALFVRYFSGLIGRPDLATGLPAWLLGAAVIATCVIANLRGARAVGGSAVMMVVPLLGPFVFLIAAAFSQQPEAEIVSTRPHQTDYVAGILVAMWNYMGWDNASTIVGEVRRPQRTYPLAMLGVLLLVVLTYLLPVMAASRSGIDPASWETGSWVEVGKTMAGPLLGAAIAVGGMIGAVGTFNSLVMSYSRIPAVLADDGYVPAVLARRSAKTNVPWVSVIACTIAWGLALQLSLPRLFALDVILYGLSLVLEFVALLALRIREPKLARPFRVPGGKLVAGILGLGPTLLIGLAIFNQIGKWVPEGDDPIAPASALLLGAALASLGPLVYLFGAELRRRSLRNHADVYQRPS